MLDVLFTLNGGNGVLTLLIMHQQMHIVSLRKPLDNVVLVFIYSSYQVVGDPDVKGPVTAACQ